MALVSQPERGTGHAATGRVPHPGSSSTASFSENIAGPAGGSSGRGDAAAAAPPTDSQSMHNSRSPSFSSTTSSALGTFSSSHSDFIHAGSSFSSSSFTTDSGISQNFQPGLSDYDWEHVYSNAKSSPKSTKARSPAVSPQPPLSLAATNTSMGNVVSSGTSSRTGHGQAQTPVSPSFAAATLGNVAVATGNRLRRAFAARRKKTGDDISLSIEDQRRALGHGRKREQQQSLDSQQVFAGRRPSAPKSLPPSNPNMLEHPPAPPPKTPSASRAFPLKYQQMMKQAAPPLPGHVPPLIHKSSNPSPPHKPAPLNLTSDITRLPTDVDVKRESLINVSPGISSALEYIRADDEREKAEVSTAKKIIAEKDPEALPDSHSQTEPRRAARETEKGVEGTNAESDKAAKRKSDSTMSHHTIRPGGVGARSSRPVSMADSLQSTHTIVPGHKRLSALLTDADYSMPEEDDTDSDEGSGEWQEYRSLNALAGVALGTETTETVGISPSSVKAQNRRSMSLNATSSSPPTFFATETHGHEQPISNLPLKPDFLHDDVSSTSVSAVSKSSAAASSATRTSSEVVAPPRSSSLSPPSSSRLETEPSRTAVPNFKHPSKSISEGVGSHIYPPSIPMAQSQSQPAWPPTLSGSSTPSSVSSPSSSLSRTAARGFISPSSNTNAASGSGQPVGVNMRARLAAWTAGSQSIQYQQHLHPGQYSNYSHHHTQASAQHQPQQRQPAISLTSGFPGAAGLAKRAVERMGRAFGSASSGSSGLDGYSSDAPSSYSGPEVLVRVASNQSVQSTSLNGPGKMYGILGGGGVTKSGRSSKTSKGGLGLSLGKPRRTPNAPSGTWSVSSSVTSSTSQSDSEGGPTGVTGGMSGPYLGKCVRPSLRPSGVVFGRPLKDVVSETAVGVKSKLAEAPSTMEQEKDGGVPTEAESAWQEARALEKRQLPALITRCAQHILLWGIQEEGLFRVSGRPSHVSKLRSEFDTGADYDMTNCEPGDLDPHSVAGVFKAYLRELPEPILTNALMPYFDAAMAQESSSQEVQGDRTLISHPRAKGPSLPAGPRAGNIPGMRKPPSLSTLAMPSFAGLRPPSTSLLKALHSLVVQLPAENRDLVRTVTELICATAREHKATKMPLSNLLLVFCPSLNMSPPLLRVLCEAREIWEDDLDDTVLDIKRESVILDISTPEKLDKLEGTGEPDDTRQTRVETIYLDSESALEDDLSGHVPETDTTSLLPDDASYLSTSEGNPGLGARSRLEASSPQLSSSVESLETPSTSSDNEHDFADDDHLYVKRPAMGSPTIADSVSSSPLSVSPGRPIISAPILHKPDPPTNGPLISHPINMVDAQTGKTILFPGTELTSPSPLRVTKKRPMPALSLPSFSPLTGPGSPLANAKDIASSPSSPVDRMRNRLRRPSLHLLFGGKRPASSSASPSSSSSPSLLVPASMSGLSPYLQAPRASSDSSVSTPISAVTAPQSSVFTFPPVLNTSIESTPLDLGFNLNLNATNDRIAVVQTKQELASSTEPAKASLAASDISDSLSKDTSSTPIADRYRSASNASLTEPPVPAAVPRTKPTSRALFSSSSASVHSERSSNHLGILDEDDDREDWSRSVLLAADMDGEWKIQR